MNKSTIVDLASVVSEASCLKRELWNVDKEARLTKEIRVMQWMPIEGTKQALYSLKFGKNEIGQNDKSSQGY